MNPRIVFMGSPELAHIILESLAQQYPLAGVVTQPDRPAGRGKVLTLPPVKLFALDRGIEVIQPNRLREPEAQAKLREWAPDVIIVAAFGQILRPNVLDLPKFGCINVHASLLPRCRGAAPIQAAILHGDAETGVTIMKMDAGIDTGDMLSQRRVKIDGKDNTLTLGEKLAREGAKLLIETLPNYLDGRITPQKQDESQATYAGMLKKEEGLLDFTKPAVELERRVRAFYPWPGTFMQFHGQPLKVLAARIAPGIGQSVGTHLRYENRPAVQTGDGFLVLDEVQPAGKRPMPGDVFLRGAQNWEGGE